MTIWLSINYRLIGEEARFKLLLHEGERQEAQATDPLPATNLDEELGQLLVNEMNFSS
jgi:hypothetical protein